MVGLSNSGSRPTEEVTDVGALAPGSVSLRVYPLDLAPAEIVSEMRQEARLAEDAGFDGCMVSEHHGGFANYLPNPLLASTWLLEATEHLWAAPCPTLLPLRPVSQIVEDLAWTHHRFPGRIGVGVGAGSIPVDFELAGVPVEEMFPRYRAALKDLADALGGRASGPLAADPGVEALAPGEIPIVAGVQTVKTTERAARFGMGALFNSLQTIEAVREQTDAYLAAGGTGSRILIRRLWVGNPPTANIETQMTRYRAAAMTGAATARIVDRWGQGDNQISGSEGTAVAEELHDAMVRSGCDTVNIRIFLAGLTPAEIHDQLSRHATETLPRLRALMGDPARRKET
jgi:alkanesulfonate monooxygenase SsuD/methylene tetrahydromethanopterin reductase-like flavin-dependent oxidoreductase (luciferase family)